MRSKSLKRICNMSYDFCSSTYVHTYARSMHQQSEALWEFEIRSLKSSLIRIDMIYFWQGAVARGRYFGQGSIFGRKTIFSRSYHPAHYHFCLFCVTYLSFKNVFPPLLLSFSLFLPFCTVISPFLVKFFDHIPRNPIGDFPRRGGGVGFVI
jgi:hypothetical protein